MDSVVLEAISNGSTPAGLRARELCAQAAKAQLLRDGEGSEMAGTAAAAAAAAAAAGAGGLSVEAVAAHAMGLGAGSGERPRSKKAPNHFRCSSFEVNSFRLTTSSITSTRPRSS